MVLHVAQRAVERSRAISRLASLGETHCNTCVTAGCDLEHRVAVTAEIGFNLISCGCESCVILRYQRGPRRGFDTIANPMRASRDAACPKPEFADECHGMPAAIEVHRGKRRRRRSRRLRRSGLVLAAIALLAVSALESIRFAFTLSKLPPVAWRKPWGGIERYEPAPSYRAARSVYPYSVVPGGVLSETELKDSIAKDPVVAQHYRGIVPERLQLNRLSAPVNMYASYRSGNTVYWTRHTIRIPKGELVLSDGAHMIRARCGNRLAFVPPRREDEHSSPWPNPTTTHSGELLPADPPELVFDYGMPPVLAPADALVPPATMASPSEEVAHYWPTAEFPPSWCCGPGGFPGGWYSAYPGKPVHPKPPAIAEPTTSLLLGSGVFVMLIRVARRPGR